MNCTNYSIIARIRYSSDSIKSNRALKDTKEGLFVVSVLGYIEKLLDEGLETEMGDLLKYCLSKIEAHLQEKQNDRSTNR